MRFVCLWEGHSIHNPEFAWLIGLSIKVGSLMTTTACLKWQRAGGSADTLGYFEFVTLMALQFFGRLCLLSQSYFREEAKVQRRGE